MSFWNQTAQLSEITGNVQFLLNSYQNGIEGQPKSPLIPNTNAVLLYNPLPYTGQGPYYACTILGVYIETKNSAQQTSNLWATGTYQMFHLDNTGIGNSPFWTFHFDESTPYFYSIEKHNIDQVCTYAKINAGIANATPGFYIGFEFKNDNLGLYLWEDVYVSIQYKLTPSFLNIIP